MTRASYELPTDAPSVDGFGVVDEKGRLLLTRSVRKILGIEPGSHVAYVVLEGALLIVPQDEHLALLSDRAHQALLAVGMTVQDGLDELSVARGAVVFEEYSTDFVREIERLRLAQAMA